MEISLIANTGIHMSVFEMDIDFQDKFKLWFHEWYDSVRGAWQLELAEQVVFEEGSAFFRYSDLRSKGYLTTANIGSTFSYSDLVEDGVFPLSNEPGEIDNNGGEIFKMTFTDRSSTLEAFENVWLPVPLFRKLTARKFKSGPYNWCRMKLVPQTRPDGSKYYVVQIAIDTRTAYSPTDYNETPVFPDQFARSMDFEICSDKAELMKYCRTDEKWSYVDEYLMKLAHPDIQRIAQLRGKNVKHFAYIATYVFLISYIARNGLFPKIILHKDVGVDIRNVDMIVDIGNSRTTVLLREENPENPSESNKPFTQIPRLELVDYTSPLEYDDEEGWRLRHHNDSFDMRVAFRRASFGDFGLSDSRQFVLPSFVRLGREANDLIHAAAMTPGASESLSTYSSPKRYLWDGTPSNEEWRFLALDGEKTNTILTINGLNKYINSDGSVNSDGSGGTTYHYSRRSLMTFSFLEMLTQAIRQLNSPEHRQALGRETMPRRIRRIIVTCPTAMSKVERSALIHCAEDAVKLLSNFDNLSSVSDIEVVPAFTSFRDADGSWYYDEATCAQLVYMFGEAGFKYKGGSSEFFNIYGKPDPDKPGQNAITVGSIDIGAGTTDLMISRYSYTRDHITRITPSPQFYDSFYFAGDDMLESLTRHIMFMSERSAFRLKMPQKSFGEFQQAMKDFVGPDYHGQTVTDRLMRRDFNLQYSIPLMYKFLELVSDGSPDTMIHYDDVFADNPVNPRLMEYFEKRFGFGLDKLDWEFNRADVCRIISNDFEPLLRKIAAIMFAHACDIILLSGRPASLPPVRELLLKYYCIAPNRLILLNDYYVGDWYPYGNNTGYVVDSKPIVAVGAAIAHYAAELSSLNNFVINTERLRSDLRSTVNFISPESDGDTGNYCLTPKQNDGVIHVSALPATLNVRQIGMASYPARTLYVINFNRAVVQRLVEGDYDESAPAREAMSTLISRKIDDYKRLMPFAVTLERDPEDKEAISIAEATDCNDNPLPNGLLEIHIQSLGAEERYWLDTGAFNF